MDLKRTHGKFYTTRVGYILDGFDIPANVEKIIEPFAGTGELVKWIASKTSVCQVEAYDIDPKYEKVIFRDTLLNPPNYENSWIITNPPYLARNKSKDKTVYDLYNLNDLYKCFILSVINCDGGIFIIPAGFFFSNRPMDSKIRHEFMQRFEITKIKYFEESVFDDTSTTIVAFSFIRSKTPLEIQYVDWKFMPSGTMTNYKMSSKNNWIVGGKIYKLPQKSGIRIRRHVEGHELRKNEQQTNMTLNSLDSGTKSGRISMFYKKGYIYQAKESSRTYATIVISGMPEEINEDKQFEICENFNLFVEKNRLKYNSLFLPQYRESKEYARKRIPFELAYDIISHILTLVVIE